MLFTFVFNFYAIFQQSLKSGNRRFDNLLDKSDVEPEEKETLPENGTSK